jgi:hypothetical protein
VDVTDPTNRKVTPNAHNPESTAVSSIWDTALTCVFAEAVCAADVAASITTANGSQTRRIVPHEGSSEPIEPIFANPLKSVKRHNAG